MLQFDQYPASFASPNFSAELHGDEPKPLMSIYVEAVVNAANLESFKAGLREALWLRPAINDSSRLDDNGKVHDLVRRFPTIKAVQFEDKLGRGYALTIKGDLLDDAKTWSDVEIGKVSVAPQDGGTARIRFRVQARGEGLEWFVSLLNQGRTITLTPPPAGYVADEESDGDPDDDPLSGSLEFGRDAKREDDSDDTGDTGAPEGFNAARMKEAAQDANQSTARKTAAKRGKKTSGATAGVH